MYIINLEIIINILNQKIKKNKLLEYGYFIAVESIGGDYRIKFINEIKNNKSYSLENPKLYIPKKDSYYFLMWCKKNGYIPMIIHTHPCYHKEICISFSKQDYCFNESFIKLGKKIGLKKYIFMVTNCKKYQLDYYDENLKYRKLGSFSNDRKKWFYNWEE